MRAVSLTWELSTLNNGSTDNCSITGYRLKVDAGPYETAHLFNCSQTGSFLVTLEVTDAGGNTDECNLIVMIKDMTNPVVTPPANVVVDCATFNPNNPATSGGTVPTATDNCSVVSITYSTGDDIITPGGCADEFTIPAQMGGDPPIPATPALLYKLLLLKIIQRLYGTCPPPLPVKRTIPLSAMDRSLSN